MFLEQGAKLDAAVIKLGMKVVQVFRASAAIRVRRQVRDDMSLSGVKSQTYDLELQRRK
jgi:hypothetical protein